MLPTSDFKIANLTVIDAAPNPVGNRLLASFTIVLPLARIRGCVLLEKADGLVKAMGPLGKTSSGRPVGVDITDPALARAITRRAAMIYSAFTGRDLSDE